MHGHTHAYCLAHCACIELGDWGTPLSPDGVPITLPHPQAHPSSCLATALSPRGWDPIGTALGERSTSSKAPSARLCERVRGRKSQLASAESSAALNCPCFMPWVPPVSTTSQQKVTRYRDMIPCSPISFTFHHAHAFLLKFYSVKS